MLYFQKSQIGLHLGSKNRIYLGVLTAIILHHLRNTFQKSIYMSKRIQTKIQAKHPDSFCYTDKIAFTQLQANTIAYFSYPKSNDTFNFIAYVHKSSTFVLYALKSEKHHTTCITIFKLRRSTLKKYYNDEKFVLMRNEYRKVIEEYIN